MRKLLAAVCVVLLCTWSGSAALAQDKPMGTLLTGAELKTLIGSGFLYDWEIPNGAIGTTLLLRTGVAHYLLFDAMLAQGADNKGRWRIEGDILCVDWEGTEEICSRHYRVGENRYESRLATNGSLRLRFTLRK